MAIYEVCITAEYKKTDAATFEKKVMCKAETPMEAITKTFTQYCSFKSGYKKAAASAELVAETFLE